MSAQPKWQIEVEDIAAEPGSRVPIKPDWSTVGVPACEESCPYYDGKRCRLIGSAPGYVCEPAVQAMAIFTSKQVGK